MGEVILETENGEDPFVCNGCLCDLVDFRFKCLSCPDFDLCEDVSDHILGLLMYNIGVRSHQINVI